MVECPFCEEEAEFLTCCDRFNSENCFEVPFCMNKDCENYDQEIILEDDYETKK